MEPDQNNQNATATAPPPTPQSAPMPAAPETPVPPLAPQSAPAVAKKSYTRWLLIALAVVAVLALAIFLL